MSPHPSQIFDEFEHLDEGSIRALKKSDEIMNSSTQTTKVTLPEEDGQSDILHQDPLHGIGKMLLAAAEES